MIAGQRNATAKGSAQSNRRRIAVSFPNPVFHALRAESEKYKMPLSAMISIMVEGLSFQGRHVFSVNLTREEQDYFKVEAKVRGVSVDDLLSSVIAIIAQDKMVLSVLDDGIEA